MERDLRSQCQRQNKTSCCKPYRCNMRSETFLWRWMLQAIFQHNFIYVLCFLFFFMFCLPLSSFAINCMNSFQFNIHPSFSLQMFLYLFFYFLLSPTTPTLARLPLSCCLHCFLCLPTSLSSYIQGSKHLQPGHHNWDPIPHLPGWRGWSQACSPSGGRSWGQLQLPPREHPTAKPHRTGMDDYQLLWQ